MMTTPPPPPVPLMSVAVQPHRGKPREIVMDEAGLLRLARDVDAALWAIRAASDRLAPPGEVVDATVYCCKEVFRGGPECELPDDHDGPCSAPSLAADPAAGTMVTAYCGQRYFDGGAWQECAEPAGHDGLHGDQLPAAARDDARDTGDDPTDSMLDGEQACAEVHPRGNYLCELLPGHDGDHDVPSCDDGSGGMTWPQADPFEKADPGYLEDAAAQDDDDTTAGELAAAEADEARSRERRSDSAVSGEAEDESVPSALTECMTAGCGHDPADHVQSRSAGERMFCGLCACRRYLGPLPAADGDPDGSQWQPEPVPRALITLECGCSFTGPVTSVKKVFCDTHGRHEPVASVAPYGDGEADEPMPVSYLPLRAAARIGGAS